MNQAVAGALAPSPLSAEQSELVARLLEGLDPAALQWLSGYMAGAAGRIDGRARVAALPSHRGQAGLTVLYGSQTGHSKRVAERLAEQARSAGLAVELVRADGYRTRCLQHERLLYLVISTHSEGDVVQPPDDARALLEFIEGRRAPRLPDLKYAVLALGDSSYPEFCAIGRQLDERLQALGATRVQALGEADVEIERVATPWVATAVQHADDLLQADRPPTATPGSGVVTPLRPAAPEWTRQRPFAAEVLLNQCIVANDSGKDVRHLELSLADSGITYQPGDAIGVWPRQAPDLVASVLEALGLDGDQTVEHEGEMLALGQWLGERRELTRLTRAFLAAHAERGSHARLDALLQPEARVQLAALLTTHQLPDVLRRWPVSWGAAELVATLRPLAPRMYSIASSQAEVGEEVHLTVVRLQLRRGDPQRWGVASRHLCDLAEGDSVRVFVEPNERFRLPADPNRDIIMIGPGTGVAPFRAFVQQRRQAGAGGRQWLFFGNGHRRTDFLYQLEWQQALRDGALTRLSVAFSRDQADKIYVQHRMRQHGAELWSWLEGGAHLYLCGDADGMAPAVHQTLRDIVVDHGGKSAQAAEAWLQDLMTAGRYARDVY